MNKTSRNFALGAGKMYMGLTCAQLVHSLGEPILKKNDVGKGGIMGVKLRKEEQRPGICMHAMRDGDIGEIVDWPIPSYIGRIVQRYKSHLLTVGRPSEEGWGDIYNLPYSNKRRVRILEPGEVLEVV